MSVLSRAEAYWQGSEYSGSGDWLDQSGNGHDHQFGDGVTGSKSPVFDTDHFTMDGTQWFEAANHANLNFGATDSFTIMAVASSTEALTARMLVGKRTTQGYQLQQSATSRVPIGAILDSVAAAIDSSGATVSGVKYVAALVRNVPDDDIEAFTDGVGSGSPTADTTTLTLSNTSPLYLGRYDGGQYFIGKYYAAAIWREALTDAEVALAGRSLSGLATHNNLAGPGQLLQTGG